MNELFSMGGYGYYVWGSYALFALALGWDYLAPRLRERNAWRALQRRLQRASQRGET